MQSTKLTPGTRHGGDVRHGGKRQQNASLRPSDLHDEVLDVLPSLKAYARSLTRSSVEADDLLQETLTKALAASRQFTPGTNLRAWLFTIQRNTFYSDCNRRRREATSIYQSMPSQYSEGNQEWSLKMRAVRAALAELPREQEEALVLVAGSGVSYEEAAEICGCSIGTIKSRINRGRCRLLYLLQVNSHGEYLRS